MQESILTEKMCHDTPIVMYEFLKTSIFFFSDSSGSTSKSSWEMVMECCNNRGRFLIEAILWWLVISLPINLASILFSIQAPSYVHSDHDNNGTIPIFQGNYIYMDL